MLNLNTVLPYLYFGYLPNESGLVELLGESLTQENRKDLSIVRDEKELINEGVNVLHGIFRDMIANTATNKLNVLPLSGGLDSRAILCGLLENLESQQIQTATYGTPGTWDYEIGHQVARAAGVRFESFDLTAEDWVWDTDKLVKTLAQTERPIWVFDAYINRKIPERFGPECIYWSGFMGDTLAGSHLLVKDSLTWEQAKIRFVKRNQFVRSIDTKTPDFEPTECLPKSPFIDSSLLCYDEQLDFGIRQQFLIQHIVLSNGYNYQTPFLNTEWVKFILNVPRCYRENQNLYKKILKAAYPRLFSLPTKNKMGLPLDAPLWRKAIQLGAVRTKRVTRSIFPWVNLWVDPYTNYIDFNRELRKCADLKAVVYENIKDLKKRRIVTWIDIDNIWNRHQCTQGNYADALTLLASLEIYLKATEQKLCA